MRRSLLLSALWLALPAPAAADYRMLGPVSEYEQEIAIAGSEVVAAFDDERRVALSAFGSDGTRRTLVPLGRDGAVYRAAASPQAIAAVTSRRPWLGPAAGPLEWVTGDVLDVAVTGTTVLTLEGGSIVARDLAAGGASRVLARPGRDPALLTAAGAYVAVAIRHEAPDSAIVVYEIASGREVYRVATGPVHGYDLGVDGRVVLVGASSGRVPIRTATPAQPQLRTIARLRVTPYVALAEDTIALARSGAVSQLVLLALDGTHRTVSGPVGPVTSLAYDGATLAFTAGRCLFGGSGPIGPPATGRCFDAAPRVRRARLRGRRLIIRLACRVPPGARCAGELRLARRGRPVVRRRVRLAPGDHVVRLRVPRRHLAAARDPDLYVVP